MSIHSKFHISAECRFSSECESMGFQNKVNWLCENGKCTSKKYDVFNLLQFLKRIIIQNSVYIIYHNLVSIDTLDLVPIQNCKTFNGYGYCKFPFIYEGKVFNKCTNSGVGGGYRPWCAMEVDWNRKMTDWSSCWDSYKSRCYNDCDGC